MVSNIRIILLLGLCCIILNLVSALPDLVAEIDYMPKNASVGDTINVTMTISNIGDADAYKVSVLRSSETCCFDYYSLHAYNIPKNSSKKIIFNKKLKYGKLELKLIVDPMNEINEINENNNNASILFNFPVRLETNKNFYLSNESVITRIIGDYGIANLSSRCVNHKIYRYINNSWMYVRDYCKYINLSLPDCPPDADVCPCWAFIPPIHICHELPTNYTWVWDPLVIPGIYKATFCYDAYCSEFYGSHNGSLGRLGYSCDSVCTETTNFTISDAILTTSPRLTTVSPGTNFTIQINISGNNIYGSQFDLYFNSTILEAINVTEGNFLKQRCTTTYSTSIINNTIGKITFANTCAGDNKADGSGVLCNITFKAKSTGSSSLNFDKVKILNNELQELYVVFTNGKVVVDSTLLADMNNDYIIGIFDLATVGKAFGSVCGDIKYNEKADINKDCKIDIFDLAFVGKNFGKRW